MGPHTTSIGWTRKKPQTLHLRVFGLSHISGFVSVLTSNSALCAEKKELLRYVHCKSSEVWSLFLFYSQEEQRFGKKKYLKLCMTTYHEHHCYPVRENRVTLIPTEECKNWTDSHLNYMA